MKNKDAEKIKELEKEIGELKDIRRTNENLEKKSAKNEKRYNEEKKKREELESQKNTLEYQLKEQMGIAEAQSEKVKFLMQEV